MEVRAQDQVQLGTAVAWHTEVFHCADILRMSAKLRKVGARSMKRRPGLDVSAPCISVEKLRGDTWYESEGY